MSHGILYYDKAGKMRKLQRRYVINLGWKTGENDALDTKLKRCFN